MKRLIIIILCALMLLALSVTERSTPAKDAAASEELPPLSGEPMSDFPETVGDLSFNTLTVDGREIRAGVIREISTDRFFQYRLKYCAFPGGGPLRYSGRSRAFRANHL